MDTKQLLDTILENVREEVTQFVKIEPTITSPIEYEQKVLSISMNFARTMINQSQGKIPKSRNLKKSNHLFWQVRIEEKSCIM